MARCALIISVVGQDGSYLADIAIAKKDALIKEHGYSVRQFDE